MSAPAFAALAFAWDEMFSDAERRAIFELGSLTWIPSPNTWRDLSPQGRAAVIAGVRKAIALGQICAQVTLVDIERIGSHARPRES